MENENQRKQKKPRSDNSTFGNYMNHKYMYQSRFTYNAQIAQETKHLHDRYKHHYVCFTCHYATKKEKSNGTCPGCLFPLTNIGLKFQAPKKTDTKGWQKAAELYKQNPFVFTYSSQGWPYDDLLP